MKSLRNFAGSLVLTPLVALTMAGSAAAAGPVTLTLHRVGSVSFPSASVAIDTRTQADEIDAALNGDTDSGSGTNDEAGVNRTLPGAKTGKGKPISPNKKPKSNPALNLSLEGLNFNNQRFANGGNQFSVEPPDQALCVGNGYVLESVNDVLRVYRTDGTPATGVVDLNTFYGYPPAIVRSGPHAGERGPSITDPSCIRISAPTPTGSI